MYLVIMTALGVGGATVLGAFIGLLTRGSVSRYSNYILALSAGVMLGASIFGLIIPALESNRVSDLSAALLGIFCGALCMDLMEKISFRLRPAEENYNKVMLFVTAIAIHNLPEGIAAGVGFGSGNNAGALMIAGGIALQNIPEGMVIIGPMLTTGMSARKAFLIALFTGLIEVAGTFIGYSFITFATETLPFSLSFAAGTMLFITCGEMIPQTCCGATKKKASYFLLAGFCVMLAFSVLL